MRNRELLRNDRGTVLMTVLLMVLLLMVAITGAFSRTMAERRASFDATAQVDAYSLAQSGLAKYMLNVTSMPASLPDSQTYTLSGGRAVVTLRALRLSSSDTMLVLISRGESTNDRYASTAAKSVRTVAQLVRYSGGSMPALAGWVSLSGLDKNGNSGSLSGVNHCPGKNDSIPGVAVPQWSTSDTTPLYTGKTSPIDGNPDNAPVTIGTPGTTGTAKDAVPIDWAGIVARTSLTPDYYQSSAGTWSPSAPPTSGSAYYTIFIDGDYTGKFPGTGNGVLIVKGNLTLNGNTDWNGVVLVGGTITSNGNNTVYGSVVTGLNIKLGQTVAMESVGNGTKIYQYDSCEIAKALAPYGGWSVLGNAWVDNFPIY
jgi:Tfp pilus assembly protein PilX